MDNYLTVRQAAKQVSKHPGTIRRWIRKGKLEAKRMGGDNGVYLIHKRVLLEFFVRRKIEP